MTRLVPVLLLATLAACQTVSHWRNPALPPKQWAADEAACKRWASRETEKEFAADLDAEADRGEAGYTRPGTHSSQMTLFESKRRRAKLTAECMQSKGYVPAE